MKFENREEVAFWQLLIINLMKERVIPSDPQERYYKRLTPW